mmetsp:Transcript_155080/g.269772  ORF Transcript_155080/g.269772 Transcript_155080/m.269772 type:complete len:86 (-) Transcript_155080:13-270(-)
MWRLQKGMARTLACSLRHQNSLEMESLASRQWLGGNPRDFDWLCKLGPIQTALSNGFAAALCDPLDCRDWQTFRSNLLSFRLVAS